MTTPLFISIPAWGGDYIDLALRYTIPSIIAARPWRGPVMAIVHTDDPRRFRDTGLPVQVREKPHGHGHAAQAIAHRDVVSSTPAGAAMMLLNADVVVSAECFSEAQRLLAGDIKVVAALGLRCLVQDSHPPIGADARTLHRWAWANRHPINEDCVWGRGRTGTPTLLFFERGHSVTARCFHLHPVFIRKDRQIGFDGTIDDDLLGRYMASEIHVVRNGEMAFAELSPESKRFARGAPLSVSAVARFGAHRFRPAHLDMFANSIRILGDDPVDESPADEIAAGIARLNATKPPSYVRRRLIRR